MLRFILPLLLIASCSFGVIKNGGDKSYVYDVESEYSTELLRELSPKIVEKSVRDPQVGSYEKVFGKGQNPIKRVGIIVFETVIQETRSGLSGEDLVYLNLSGKQLLTERLFSIWEQSFPILAPELDFVKASTIKKAKPFLSYGLRVDDEVKTRRHTLASDDIFYLEKGKLTPSTTLINPRGMRDLSLLFVPASDLMGGPKFSEHHKHFVNELARDLKLDAVIVVKSTIGWTASRIEKNSGKVIPEEVVVELESSVLIPFSSYHQRLNKVGITSNLPKINTCFGAYKSKINIPVLLNVGLEDRNFSTIEKELLSPMLKTYKDITQSMIMRMSDDLKATF